METRSYMWHETCAVSQQLPHHLIKMITLIGMIDIRSVRDHQRQEEAEYRNASVICYRYFHPIVPSFLDASNRESINELYQPWADKASPRSRLAGGRYIDPSGAPNP